MAKISLEVITQDSSVRNRTTTVSDINPEVENSKLRQFAVMLNALTNHTFISATKITKETVI